MHFCTEHHQQPFNLICVAQHYCQRKLCSECQHEHGVDSKQILSIHKFQDKLKKRVEKFNLITQISQQNYTSLHLNFKSLLVQSEEMIKNMYQNLTQSINKIFDMVEQEDQYYHNLLSQFTNPLELSYIEINKLVQILKEKTLENWNSQKEQYLSQLNKVRQWLDIEMSNFVGKFNRDLIKDVESIVKIEKIELTDDYYWQEGIKEYECQQYTKTPNNDLIAVKAKFTVTKTKNKEIIYSSYGMSQRIEQIIEVSNKKPELLRNLDQIKHLQWVGEYGSNHKKVGKWIVTWKGQSLYGVGGLYSDDGKKQGKWKELIPNYCDEAQVYEFGEYVNDERNGIWKYILSTTEIGGGLYLENGKKNGQWIELSDNFWSLSQVTYHGQYQNGNKLGKWDINYHNEIIGGGSYLENFYKNGYWEEQNDNFFCDCQVTYNGIYKKGIKIGKWNTNYRYNSDQQFEQIGGGNYDDHGIKNGKWTELSEKFWNLNQVIYHGNYHIGKKYGKWEELERNKWMKHEGFKKIGEQKYEDQCVIF
ncbi:unnamed protein product [Paramecium primaurelia]|uniref:Uncharacterized protein n=1 Tax=Paramecium primaurelia TaxID=5886 RepID=A0A8S1NL47_PARPR|nr:unnamed protein product [Paramecium primaurelia]